MDNIYKKIIKSGIGIKRKVYFFELKQEKKKHTDLCVGALSRRVYTAPRSLPAAAKAAWPTDQLIAICIIHIVHGTEYIFIYIK